MGETAADTRREIEETRRDLGTTLTALRARTVVVRGRVIRVVVVAGAAAGAAGVAVATVLVIRRRRGGAVTRAATHLPTITHDAALPFARFTDRWLAGRGQAARRQREEIVEGLSKRIAENQAHAQRRANPLWRRAAGTALETAATVGVTALVRRAMEQRNGESAVTSAQSTGDHGLVGSANGETSRESESTLVASGRTAP